MTTNLTLEPNTASNIQRRNWLKLMAVAGSAAGTAALPLPAAAAAGPVWVPAEMPNPAPASEGMVDVGGAKLWYWDTGGNGQPVIFLHAGSQSGAGWGYQQPVFAGVSSFSVQ